MTRSFVSILAVITVVQLLRADDFKTTNGKEYKNAKLSRVEPDGIVITFSGGIVKIPFLEMSRTLRRVRFPPGTFT